MLQNAFASAIFPRKGPVWLDIPLDIQAAEADFKDIECGLGSIGTWGAPGATDFDNKFSQVKNLLVSAKRPVILAGAGIDRSSPDADFVRDVERLGIPVLTTWRAADLIPDYHPLYFGRPGTIAQKAANLIQQKADLILCLGARLDLLQVGFRPENFAPHATKVIVDIDEAGLNKYQWERAFKFQCDASWFLHEMARAVSALKWPPPSARAAVLESWQERCSFHKHDSPVFPKEYKQRDGYINPYQFIEELAKASGPDDVIVPASSGSAAEMMAQTWPIKNGQRFIFSPGLGSMGWGLPQAIGVALASRRRVICVIGDGDLQHNIQELQTLARLGLPVKLFIWNNGGYNSIRNSMTAHFGNPVCCGTPDITFPALKHISDAVGVPYWWLRNVDDLRVQIEDSLFGSGSYITEVMIDPDVPTAPRLKSVMVDGQMQTAVMEDV